MRYRKLSPTGDYVFGHQQKDFYIDQPEAVAQAVLTRLELLYGEWWLDITEGTDWDRKVLGMHTIRTRDALVQARILTTPGVTTLNAYASQLIGRAFTAQANFNTIYGQTGITQGR